MLSVVFTARCHASAASAVIVRLSVRLSVWHKYYTETANRRTKETATQMIAQGI